MVDTSKKIQGVPNTCQKQIYSGEIITWDQSHKDFYTLGQIYKPVLKHENMR